MILLMKVVDMSNAVMKPLSTVGGWPHSTAENNEFFVKLLKTDVVKNHNHSADRIHNKFSHALIYHLRMQKLI